MGTRLLSSPPIRGPPVLRAHVGPDSREWEIYLPPIRLSCPISSGAFQTNHSLWNVRTDVGLRMMPGSLRREIDAEWLFCVSFCLLRKRLRCFD